MLTPLNSPNRRDMNRRFDDDDNDDDRSVDLLADTPPPKGAVVMAAEAAIDSALGVIKSDNVTSSPIVSPATKTINHLSQPTTDLHYDMSQLDHDVAHILHSVKKQDVSTVPDASPSSFAACGRMMSLKATNTILGQSREGADRGNSEVPKKTNPADPSPRADAEGSKSNPVVSANAIISKKNPETTSDNNTGTAAVPLPASQLSFSSQRSTKQAWPVEQYNLETKETIAIWPSLRMVAREFNMVRHHLKDALQGRRESVRGFGWRLAGPVPAPGRITVKEPPPSKSRSRKTRAKSFQTSKHLAEDVVPRTRKRKAEEESPKKSLEASPSKRPRRCVESKRLDEKTTFFSTVSRNLVPYKSQYNPTISRGSASSHRTTSAVSLRSTSSKKGPTSVPEPCKKTVPSSKNTSDNGSVQSMTSYQSVRGPIGQMVAQIDISSGDVLAIFRSQREAERATKIDRKQITKVLTGEETEVGGYRWRVARPDDLSNLAANNKDSKRERQSQASTKHTPMHEKTNKKEKLPSGKKKIIGRKRIAKTEAYEKIKAEDTDGVTFHFDELSIGDYRILRFEIFVEGKIGFEIGGCDTHNDLKAALERQEGHTGAIKRCAMVLCVDQDGVAQQIGLRPGDCFVEEDKSSPGIVTLCRFDDVRSKAKSAPRPLEFFVARRKVVFSEFVSKALAENSNNLATDGTTTQSKKGDVVGTANKQKPGEIEDMHPFCIKCTGKNVRAHHPWCPKHKHFLISGADEILEHLKRGMSMNCKLCLDEYTAGRTMITGIHRFRCPRRLPGKVEKNKTLTQKKQDEKKRDEKTAKILTQKVSSKGRTICPTVKLRNAADHVFLAASEDSDVSDFDVQEIVKTIPSKSQTKGLKGKKGNIPKENQTKTQKAEATGKTATGKKNAATVNKSTKAWLTHGTACYQENYTNYQLATKTAHSDLCDSEDEASPKWITAENPWGPDSCQGGDIVVFAPQLPFEQQEYAFLSERFEHDPFSTYSRYGKSHTPPEEGLHTLVLRRDIMSKTPWGFSVYRHEFGGACLVQDVFPGSPAYTATFAGSSSNEQSLQGVAVNDMIVAINGKLTSGMTTIEFDVELELSGPSLLLTVSRYKSPKRVIESLVHKEQEVLSKLNDMSKEEQHLGWIDYAGGKDGGYPTADISVVSGHSNNVSRLGAYSRAEGTVSSMFGSSSDDDSLGPDVGPLQRLEKSETGPKFQHQSTPSAKTNEKREDIPTSTTKGNQEYYGNTASPQKPKQTSLSRVNSTTPRRSNYRIAEVSLARTMPSKKSFPEDIPESSMDSSASALEEEWSDDGNAWLGCVCGTVHDEKTNVFWIQCDRCQSWYNVAKECTGMSKSELSKISEWFCWACEPASDPGEITATKSHWRRKVNCDTLRTYRAKEMADSNNSVLVDACKEQVPSGNVDDSSRTKGTPKFEEDDMVYVEEHAWTGVNNCEGVARILAVYMNADGDALYDIKYVVGGKKKGIFEKYLSRHHF